MKLAIYHTKNISKLSLIKKNPDINQNWVSKLYNSMEVKIARHNFLSLEKKFILHK